MTREQKMEWLEKADNEMLIEQLRRTVMDMKSDFIGIQVQAQEDYELITAEMLKRMSK